MQFFAEDLYEEIDFSKGTEFLDKEFLKIRIPEKKGRVNADQVVKVFLKSGQERWILIHIEVQDKVEEDFAKRMFRYFYRIYDKHNREVYAIALLTDAKRSKATDHFHYEFFRTKVDYKYNVYSFYNQSIEKLEDSPNPFAAAVIASIYASKTKLDAQKRYTFKRKLMIQILQKTSTQQEYTRTYLSALFHFIDNILQVSDDLTTKLKDDIIPYLGKEAAQQMQVDKRNQSQTLAEIIDELEEKGKQKATRSFAKELIRDDFPNERIAKLTKLDLAEVVKLRKSLEL